MLTTKVESLKVRTPIGKSSDERTVPSIAHSTLIAILQVNNTSSPGNRTANSGVTIGSSVMEEQSKNMYCTHVCSCSNYVSDQLRN